MSIFIPKYNALSHLQISYTIAFKSLMKSLPFKYFPFFKNYVNSHFIYMRNSCRDIQFTHLRPHWCIRTWPSTSNEVLSLEFAPGNYLLFTWCFSYFMTGLFISIEIKLTCNMGLVSGGPHNDLINVKMVK